MAKEALVRFKKYPDDPHDADLLGFAMRVVRNRCCSDVTDELNHQLFDILHRIGSDRPSLLEWPLPHYAARPSSMLPRILVLIWVRRMGGVGAIGLRPWINIPPIPRTRGLAVGRTWISRSFSAHQIEFHNFTHHESNERVAGKIAQSSLNT